MRPDIIELIYVNVTESPYEFDFPQHAVLAELSQRQHDWHMPGRGSCLLISASGLGLPSLSQYFALFPKGRSAVKVQNQEAPESLLAAGTELHSDPESSSVLLQEGYMAHKGLTVNANIFQYVPFLVLLHRQGFLQGHCRNNFNKPYEGSLSPSWNFQDYSKTQGQ